MVTPVALVKTCWYLEHGALVKTCWYLEPVALVKTCWRGRGDMQLLLLFRKEKILIKISQKNCSL